MWWQGEKQYCGKTIKDTAARQATVRGKAGDGTVARQSMGQQKGEQQDNIKASDKTAATG